MDSYFLRDVNVSPAVPYLSPVVGVWSKSSYFYCFFKYKIKVRKAWREKTISPFWERQESCGIQNLVRNTFDYTDSAKKKLGTEHLVTQWRE